MSGPFSDSYHDARSRFLDACTTAGARLQSHENHNARGPRGERLFLDAALFGDHRASTFLLITSGTHGAEGFVGSAAQLAWIADGGPAALPPDTAALMIHAVNPFGFAHGLRCTEDNIDVNRNWIDHTAPAPANDLYAELHPILCVGAIDDHSFAAAAEAVADLADQHGSWTVDDALSRGQYAFADGYYYGGTAPAWSQRMVAAVVSRGLRHARRVAVIDWHSGPVGNGEIIYLCYDDRRSEAFRRAASWWGHDNLDDREVDRLWGGRRPGRHGVMVTRLASLLDPRATMAGGVVELCSASPPRGPAGAFRIPMIERWLRFVGGLDHPQAGRLLDEIEENYAPRRRQWRERAIENALEICQKTIDGLARWADEPLVPGERRRDGMDIVP